MRQLARIAGVVSVGFGFKETLGRLQGYWAYRVYVRQKRALGGLRARERIPRTINGFYTDVLAGGDEQVRLESSLPDLSPGTMIARYLPGLEANHGSVGLIVRRDGRDHLLTAHHVLASPTDAAASANQRKIYSPDYCALAEVPCNQPVAELALVSGEPDEGKGEVLERATGGEFDFVDAGLAALAGGVEATNVSRKLGGQLGPALRDLRDVPRNGMVPVDPIVVRKHGAATGVTHGVVAQVQTNVPTNKGDVAVWQLLIHPNKEEDGGFAYDETVKLPDDSQVQAIKAFFKDQFVSAEIDASKTRPTVRFHGPVFSLGRDSGSALVDANRNVVGIHRGQQAMEIDVIRRGKVETRSFGKGVSSASHIVPVFDVLDLDRATAIKVTASTAAGHAVDLSRFDRDALERRNESLTALADATARTAAGRDLLDVVREQLPQLRELVHHRRRVTIAWHRWKGPAFVTAFLRAAEDPSRPLPSAIDGVTLEEMLTRMRDVLRIEGDDSLRQAIERQGSSLIGIARRAGSIEEAVRAFGVTR